MLFFLIFFRQLLFVRVEKKRKTIDIISIIPHSGYYAKLLEQKKFEAKIDIRRAGNVMSKVERTFHIIWKSGKQF